MFEGLEQGLTVMVIGFSTVFVFLIIMIFAMHIMSAVVGWLNKIFPVAAPASSAPAKALKGGDDAEIAIAIACATLKQNHG